MKVNLASCVKQTALISVLSLFSIVGFSAQSMEERLQRLEQMAESRGQLQADIMFQLNALQQELQQLRGQVEQHQFQLKQLQDRQRDLYRDIERRLSQLQSGTAVKGSNPSLEQPSSTTTSNNSVSAPSTAASGSVDIHSEYQNIFAMVRDKQYDQAVVAYQKFLKTYPNSQYEANVHYWLGQIYYIRQQLDLALEEYRIVTSRFAESSRAADALFKQGKVLALQNKRDEAKAVFNQVIEKYDGTLEQLARTELQKLK
jgi:tol-pal system protein YbgF